jgi:serine O-acetyltransferase
MNAFVLTIPIPPRTSKVARLRCRDHVTANREERSHDDNVEPIDPDTGPYHRRPVHSLCRVDIHPAARFGAGIFFDHATGIVIGETSVVEHSVSILQNVTLGETGRETGERHPKVRHGVLIGAGAIILGNIEIGNNARIGAGSAVLKPVAPGTMVAGVPARMLRRDQPLEPSRTMNQVFGGSQPERDDGPISLIASFGSSS